MPLDIFIENDNERSEMLPLFIEEYSILMERLEKEPGPFILKDKLIDYYGESEIYLNELDSIKEEVEQLKIIFKVGRSNNLIAFLDQFLDLIEYAVKRRKTIKLVGD